MSRDLGFASEKHKIFFSLKKIFTTRLTTIYNRKIKEKEIESKKIFIVFVTISLKLKAHKTFKIIILEYIFKNLAKK